MKIKNLIFLMFLGIAVLLPYNSVLAVGPENLTGNGNVKVETVDFKNKHVSNVKVYQENHLFVIYGKVSPANKTVAGRGHVDITLTGPDGNVLTKIFLPYVHSVKFKNRAWNFHAKIHIIPPKGSVMNVMVAD